MADRYDVATRLADGGPAVEHIQTYVRACQALGYQQSDLTSHPSQVDEWYQTEAGLDLRVLAGDVTELHAAVTAIEEALWVQRSQVSELAAAWRGSGADSASGFLQRHCDAAAELAARIRAAAAHCATLRDDVWRAVDGKVAAAMAIDERSAAQRSTWLAAAHALSASPEERSAAELVIHQQVIPFVDNDIRCEWIRAMSSANASVAASYDSAINALASIREVSFDVPGDLGPRWHPASDEHPLADVASVVSPSAGPLQTVPAAAAAPSIPEAAQDLSTGQPDEAPSDATAPVGGEAGLSSGAGGLGGLGGMNGGLGGVVESIVDGIGSLLGSLAGGLGGGQGLGDDPLDLDDVDDPGAEGSEKHDKTDLPADSDSTPSEARTVENPSTSADVAVEPGAQLEPPGSPPAPGTPPADTPPDVPLADGTPQDATPPAAPPPAPAPAASGSTPCEIAEDQLPQAGQ